MTPDSTAVRPSLSLRSLFLAAVFLFGLLSVTIFQIVVSPHAVLAGSDTYPAPWAPPTVQDSMLDTWKEYNRECTSYAAWMLHSVNGYEMPFNDDAVNWGTDASNINIPVNMIPAVGSIFWSKSSDHVAYVESVSADGKTITTEDYNSGYPTNPGWWAEHTAVATSSASGYIHFKDLTTTTPKNHIIATEPNGANSVKYMIGVNDGTGLSYAWDGTNLTLNTAPTHMVIADLNGDGKADILATEPTSSCPNGVKYMVGISNGDNTFNWDTTNLTCNTPPTQLAVGNALGNGRMEIIATEPSCSGGVKYIIGVNDGTGLNFAWDGTNLSCNTPPTHLSVADMNNDGKADIVATEPACSGGVRYMVGMSNGNNTFNWDSTNLTCNTAPTQMDASNALGNGKQVIIATEPNGANSVKYMIGVNDGTGLSYAWDGTNLTLNTAPTHMVLGDMNNDGKADIISTEPACSGGVQYMVGMSNGNNTFNWDSTNLTCNTSPNQIGVGKARG